MDARHRFRSLAVLIFILSAYLNTSLAKQHPVRHAHSRHKRQHGPRTFSPDHFIMDGPGGPEYGDWGHWSEQSECSRTCGGGVAFQTRHCRDIGPDGNIRCQGGSKRYFSCNVQDCPDGEDFRAQQCAEFNRVPIDNKFYDWIPYTNAPNQCELNCMPRGERFFYRHKRKVADGTRCNDERLDICVDGQCLPVGCDRMLGSDAREDKCRECRGDGSSCYTVEGVLDNNDLQVGYNDILLIPAGATNIKVKEIQPTNNYLAIRNTSGHYYLNGNWRIDFPRDLPFIGTIFHYERKPHKFYAPEAISALGPTTEAIYVSLLYQERNPGIMYEYSIPTGVSPHFSAENYTWVEGEFGECSRTCGGGMQRRYIQCVRKSDMTPVSSDLCDSSLMPPMDQQCGLDPCPPEWTAGHWSGCSESCERGIKERQVYCTQVVANGLPSVVDENECANAGPKPATKEECNVETVCPSWHIGPWKPCDRLCGDGRERRDVVCYRKVEGRIEVLDDRYCTGERPESEKPCMIRPCDGVDWITSEWSGCDEKCGLTQETRTVQCATQTGTIFPNSFCHEYRIPELVRECESPKKCEHEWYAGQWSKCSAKCGSGVQTRKVFCGMIDDEGLIKKVEDDNCDAADKYESEQVCEGVGECNGDWFSGPWSQCSKPCGGGEKMRKVLCLENNETVPVTNCDANSVPFGSESCNVHPCEEDEVYTVEPTHDLSEDEEEDCEEEDEEGLEEEGATTPLAGASTEEQVSGVTGVSEVSDLISGFTDLSSEPSSMGSSEISSLSSSGSTSEMSSVSSSSSSSSGSSISSSMGSTESSVSSPSTESSSEMSSSSSDSTLSSESSSSSESTESSSSMSSDSSSAESSSSSEMTSSSPLSSESTSSSDLTSESSSSSDMTSESSSSDMTSESSSSSSDMTSESSPSDMISDSSSSSDLTSESSSSSDMTSESSSSSGMTSDTSPSDMTSDSSPTSDMTSDTPPSDMTSDSSPTSDMTSESSSSSDMTSESSSSSSMTSESSSSSSDMTSESLPSDMTSDSSSTSDMTSESSSTSETTSESSSSSESTSESSTSSDETTLSSLTSDTSPTDESSSSTGSSLSTDSSSSSSSISSDSTSDGTSSSSSSISSSISSSDSSSSSTESMSSTDSTSLRNIGEVDSELDESTTESQSTSTGESTITESTLSSLSSSSESTSETSSSSEMSSSSESSSSSLSSSSSESSSTSESTSSSESSSSSLSSSSSESSSTSESSSSSEGSSTSESSTSSPISSSSESSTSSLSSLSSESSSSSESTSSLSSSSSESTVSSESTLSSESSSDVTSSSELSSLISSESTVSDMSSAFTSSSEESTGTGEWSTTGVSELFGTFMTSVQMAITKEQRLKKCKPRKKPACMKSEFGCCPDNKTPAEGPFSKGCPQPETCAESTHGCCPDGVSPALGKNNKGCPPSQCKETLFGCCLDGVSISQGNDYEGCPEDILPVACSTSQFGCCPDNMTSATGPKFQGCFTCEGSGDCETCKDTKFGCCPDNLRAASGPDFEGCEEGSGAPEEAECAKSTYGCCPDGIIAAEGPNYENCGIIENCNQTYFGCCPDGVSPAQGSRFEGCRMPCETEKYGCCDDNYTPAHGPNKEGCCLLSPYGCCPDNILYARGPNFEGCGCHYSPFGCCPDNATAARGYNKEGCGCQYTEYGCCQNNYTPAAGPGYQGCPCYTFQFGCCPDGVTTAKGPQRLGCGCENTEFGCCSDGKTPASGPEQAGCGCVASRFGCCPDGVTESQGENFEGCTNVPLNPGEICRKEKDRGSCRNFTIKWYYDMEYGGCSKFWYGGCEGNENRFRSLEECKGTCIEPEGKARCNLPKVKGPCEGYNPKWFYDSNRKQCGQFIYGGCLGNSNNFDSREECQEVCAADQILDACDQEMDEGPCQGGYRRWYYNKDYKTCLEFRYGGCKANSNNFPTQSACIEQCLQPGRKRVSVREICRPKKDSGPCLGTSMRWYYDGDAESCRPFLYGGCLGNTNRFKTEAECKLKCHLNNSNGDHCSLPRDPGNCTDRQPRWFFDYAENRCMPFYYTGCEGNGNRFETLEACEADCPPRVHQDLCMLPALLGECHNYTERWYYDAQSGYCKQFYYGGCGGNHNNFESREACQRRCEPGHEPPAPEATPPPPTQPPEADPFRIEYCFYDSDPGPCRPEVAEPQWFYDRADGVCKHFLYGGCGGNRNRFATREECEHNCRGAQDLCSLPKTVGPCDGSFRQWYYDRQTDSCYEFDYGGCLGNENRFFTRYDCEIRCKQGPVAPPTQPTTAPEPPRPAPDASDFCYAPVDPGPCLEERTAWYFDAQRGSCQAFVYGGCGGNPNRFDSEEQCERQCGRFKGQDICNIPYDAGVCRGTLYKWYYDANQRACKSFVYGGCEGNGNRFSSIEECETICLHREEVIPNANETFFSEAICRLPMVTGPCTDGHYKRWYFDEVKSTCLPFIYSGCGGNFNRFKNFDTCVKFCRAELRDLHPPPLYEEPDPNEILPPNYCESAREECRTLHCPYGVEKFIDSQDCERCRCNDPCRDERCPEGTRCAVDLYSESPYEIHFRSICREENKPGQCPALATGSGSCTTECHSDADCQHDAKCCSTGCGSSCVEPVRVTVPPTRPPETPRPYYTGVQPPSIFTNEPEVTSEEGSFATLKCIVRGVPTPVVEWRKDNSLIDGSSGRHRFLPDGSLQIIGLYRTDAGVYVCKADNGEGHPAEKEFILHVTDPVERPAEVVGDESNSVVVTLGSPTILHCYVIGWPRPKVIWWRGDQILPLSFGPYEQRRDLSLLIKTVSLRDLGPYVCQAYNGYGKAVSGTITVQAIGPVYSNNPEDEPYFQYLVPAPQRHPETPTRPIYRPYTQTTPVARPTTTPAPVHREPPAPQPEPEESPRVYRVPLSVNIPLDKTSFPVDSDISIPCDVDGYPIPRVTWYKGDEVLQSSRKIEITESNRLRIIRADGGDSGMYTCTAENQFESASSTVQISVEGVYIHPNCTDNVFFANCELIVKAHHCQHRYYARFCCRSCTQAGQLPSYGPHLDYLTNRRVQE